MTRQSTSPETDNAEPRREEPVFEYGLLASVFFVFTTASYATLRIFRRKLPKVEAVDLLLLGLATNRLSRLITRDKVARPVRAPFTEVDHNAPPGTPNERARGSGLTKAVGELVTCPRCAAIWGSAALTLTYVASRPMGRFVSVLLSSAAISDFVNRRYAVLQEQERNLPRSANTAPGPALAPPV